MIEAAPEPVRVRGEMCLLRCNLAVRHVGMTEARRGQDYAEDGENLGGYEILFEINFDTFFLAFFNCFTIHSHTKTGKYVEKAFCCRREKRQKSLLAFPTVCLRGNCTDWRSTVWYFLCFLSFSFSFLSFVRSSFSLLARDCSYRQCALASSETHTHATYIIETKEKKKRIEMSVCSSRLKNSPLMSVFYRIIRKNTNSKIRIEYKDLRGCVLK
jgi:hypothetical protein